MTELINALIRLANAAALYFEQQTHPKTEIASGDENIGTDVPASAVETKRARKPRAVKVEAAAPVAVAAPASAPAPAAPASDPLAELGLPPAAPAVPAAVAPAVPAPVLTPEQSTLEMKKIAVKCVQLFKADTPNGEARLTGLLANRYKVNRLSELSHENRLDFIAQVQAIIVAGGKA